jgi:isopenicillin N synthase-like dioxygenase
VNTLDTDPPADASPSTSVLDQVMHQGYALVRLDETETGHLAAVYQGVLAFFAQDVADKARHGVPNRSTGYRPYAYAHAGDPDRPDHNDSYLFWGRDRKLPGHHEEMKPLLDMLEDYRRVAARITHEVIEELRAHYGYSHELPFERGSVLQINSFATPTEDELLQQAHEDAVFLTVIWTSAEGLEGVRDGELLPFTFAPDEVLVMPGSVMTAMTGGEIPPFHHQVRNHRTLGRKSVMYFVSPDPSWAIEPFVANESNRGTDIRQLVIGNPQTFGLAEDFVVDGAAAGPDVGIGAGAGADVG